MVAKFRAPGMYRAVLSRCLGVVLAYAIIGIFRAWYGYDPLFKGDAVLELALFASPLGFLVGLGALRLLVPLGRRQADRARGPLRPRRASGATTSASTPTTRSSASSTS